MEDRSVKRQRLRRLLIACLAAMACGGGPASAVDPSGNGNLGTRSSAAAFRPVREPSARGDAGAVRPDVPTITSGRLAQQAAEWVLRGEQELRRGTLLSAQQSAFDALRAIAEAKDYHSGGSDASAQLRQAVAALREAADFAGRFGDVGPAQIDRMVRAHETPVLKGRAVDHLSGSEAADLYLDFARQQLAAVASGDPIGVRALALLAAVQHRQAVRTPISDATAISLLRAAVQADPQDPLIANELGYQLLQQGLRDEAGWVLRHSLALQPTEAAVRNMAEVLRQQGQLDQARQLIATLDQLPQAAAPQPQWLQLTPEQFAAVSPPTAAPTVARAATATPAPPLPGIAASPQPAAAAARAATADQADSQGPIDRFTRAVSQFWK